MHIHVSFFNESLKLQDNVVPQQFNKKNINHATDQEASACLIIKDDNPRLIEWLAYHYQVLPLRTLILTADPLSRTSPKEVLDRWRNNVKDLEIIVWDEYDFDFNGTSIITPDNKDSDLFTLAEQALVARQRSFYSSCAIHLKKMKKSWVFIVDVDEYVAFNKAHHDDPSKTEELENHLNALPEIKRSRQRKHRWRTHFEENLLRLRRNLPEIGQETVMEYIHRIREDPFSPFVTSTNYVMPRLFFSSKEPSRLETSMPPSVRTSFDPLKFDTLRYFRHAEKGSFKWNRYGKSMLDVSRIPFEHLRPVIHEHLGVGYTDDYDSVFYSQSLFRVNHYLGSWDAYSREGDDRRNRNDYRGKARINEGTTFDMQPWLEAFVQNVGIDRALKLLEGIGEHGVKQRTRSKKIAEIRKQLSA